MREYESLLATVSNGDSGIFKLQMVNYLPALNSMNNRAIKEMEDYFIVQVINKVTAQVAKDKLASTLFSAVNYAALSADAAKTSVIDDAWETMNKIKAGETFIIPKDGQFVLDSDGKAPIRIFE